MESSVHPGPPQEPKMEVGDYQEPGDSNTDQDQHKPLTVGQLIEKVDSLMEQQGWDDFEAANQASYMAEGQAKDILIQVDDSVKQSWNLMRAKLITEFEQSATTPLSLKEKIHLRKGLRQKRGETVQEFHDRCCDAQLKISDDPPLSAMYERDVLLNFVLGLKGQLQEQVMTHDCNNLNGFLQVAMTVEIDHNEQMAQVVDDEYAVANGSPSKVKSENTYDSYNDPDWELSDNVPSNKDSVKHEPQVELDEEDNADGDDNDESETRPNGEEIEYHCQICSRGFCMKLLLQQHVEKEHDQEKAKFKCEHCTAFFVSQRAFKIHMNQMHRDNVFPCEECKHKSYNYAKSIMHMATHHLPTSSQPPKVVCRFCSKLLNNMETLRKHVKSSHINDKQYQCKVCDKAFNFNAYLQQHIRAVHLNERGYECGHCDKHFSNTYSLRYHRLSAHNIGEKYRCDQCEKTFNSNAALKEHVARYHTKEPTYMCDECGKGFFNKSNLKVHVLNVHKALEKNVRCAYYPECKNLYKTERLMKDHIKAVHTKETMRYSCEHCPQKFATQGRKFDHINGVHLNKKPHECPYANCGFVTAYREKIRKHIKGRHGGVGPPQQLPVPPVQEHHTPPPFPPHHHHPQLTHT